MRLLQWLLHTLHRPGRPHPFPDCGLAWLRPGSLTSTPLSFSGGPDAFSQALQRQSPLPLPSLPAPPSRGASLGGQWQERANKVDTRQITAMLARPSTERGKGEKWSQETCSPDSNCLCSSSYSTWKHPPEATTSPLPQYKAQVSFPTKEVTLRGRKNMVRT